MAVISMKHFLEAGVHFGHQTKRWNPKMAPYIYGVKSGIHIIDLRQTLRKLQEAYLFVKEASTEGKSILFVGTKQSIQKIVLEEAKNCDSFYINFRWLGGFLTNFSTVKQSIGRLQSYEEIAGEDRAYEGILKKEALQIERKRQKLDRSLGGVRTMKDVPGVIFIIDCKREHLAVREAQKLGIPIVGIADTNCDPSGIDYVIPGNDDSPKAVQLYASVVATAVQEGRTARALVVTESTEAESSPADTEEAEAKEAPEEIKGAKPKKTAKKIEKPVEKPIAETETEKSAKMVPVKSSATKKKSTSKKATANPASKAKGETATSKKSDADLSTAPVASTEKKEHEAPDESK